MKYINVDTSRLPIIYVRFKSFVPTLEQFLEHQRDTLELLNTYENFLIIWDFTDMAFLPSELRVVQAKFIETHKELIRSKVLGMVFLTPSLAGSLVLKGTLVLSKPPVPYIVVRNMDQAEAWARKKIEESNQQKKIHVRN